MIIPPGPYRLEFNGELVDNYQSLLGMRRAINALLRHNGHKGEFRGFDTHGRLLMLHTGTVFQEFPIQALFNAPRHGPCVKLVKAVA